MADEFGGFDDFDDDPIDTTADAAAAEDFGSAFTESGGDDFDGFGDEDFEDFAEPSASTGTIAEEGEEFDDDFEDDDSPAAAPAPAGVSAAKKSGAETAKGGALAPSSAAAGQPTKKLGASARPAETFMKSQAVAIKMNKSCRFISQPFISGYDMTSDSTGKVGGRGLRRILINACMTAPGSIAAEIRTGPGGTGDVLAKDSGVRAPSNFTKTILDFSDQPVLKEGEIYYLHIILQQGAFKLQGAVVKSIKTIGKSKSVHCFSAKHDDSWNVSNSAIVLKPVYQKVIPQMGDKSGFLLVKRVPRGSRGRRTSLRRGAKEGMRKFVVVESDSIKQYSKPEGTVEKEITIGTVEYIESKGGSMDTKDFRVVTKTEEWQFAAPSASECQKWLQIIEKSQKTASRAFGSAATTNMMF
eukprot:CAMPEP_0182919922 /NCGR_PEP_ID=MMETSP0105_2-20130417/3086_1 /TAXON_ID=81532 ORGANISM="Acanthoeca-like sp., Strain 10tr" /NCGR_SAMPLE_ID=MMETSP0105_2 /ASSEMBLY_ACC=CAM_ASM_000205 /LENGTH=412 /DNA_ID=CAMNT_0025057211 /DNA_START=42 /DNA_END=1280 /DNA_ORIENTATION=-